MKTFRVLMLVLLTTITSTAAQAAIIVMQYGGVIASSANTLISATAAATSAPASPFELISRTDGEPLLVTEPSSELSDFSVSANGRFVAFESEANNLVADDPNGTRSDIFVFDRATNNIDILTRGGNFESVSPSISTDGRFVAFDSRASNLVAGQDTGGNTFDVFLHDRDTGITREITVGGNDDSRRAVISANGRFVAFESRADNLVAGDTNGIFDIFVYDSQTDTIELLAPGGGGAFFAGSPPAINADGRFVAFTSDDSSLAPGDTNGETIDVFVFDRDTDTIELITAGANNESIRPSISADGQLVAFDSRASNLVAEDTNGAVDDIFVYNRATNTTEILTAGGDSGSRGALISNDGRFVAFGSGADNLVAGVTDGTFVHDRETGLNTVLEPDTIFNPATANAEPVPSIDIAFEAVGGDSLSSNPAVSATGQFVAFESSASNLVVGDANGVADIFVRDRETQALENITLGANGSSSNPSISANGSIVVFESEASNIAGVTPIGRSDIFLHNRNTGITELVTAGANSISQRPVVSGDGRFVAFLSFASTLVDVDNNGTSHDIFVYDRLTRNTEILTNGGNTAFRLTPIGISISEDGQFVAFQSPASNLAAGDSNGDDFDIFVHDRATGITELITAGGDEGSFDPSISADGRFVAFLSRATNLVSEGNAPDLIRNGLFIHDRESGSTEILVSRTIDIVASPSISADGQLVAYSFSVNTTNATIFVPQIVVLIDRDSGNSEQIAENADANIVSPSISADGSTIAFVSRATNLTNDGILPATAEVDGRNFNITNVFVSTDNARASANAITATTTEDTAVTFTVTGSDPDGDSLTFEAATLPSSGSLSGAAPNFTYTPNANFFGIDSFTFTANDGSGPSLPATVTIDVAAVNDAPVAIGTGAGGTDVVTTEDTAVAITLLGSDIEGDVLSYTITSLPSNGALSGSAPDLTYTPSANFSGSDSFSFAVSDGQIRSVPIVVNLSVSAQDDAPTSVAQSLATAINTAVAITLTGTDPDTTSLNFSIVGFPANGTLSGDLPNLTYTPGNDFLGVDSFSFTVSDGNNISAPATVLITVAEVNEPPPGNNNVPVVDSQSISTAQDTSISIVLTGSDADGDSLSFSFVSLPANGSLSGSIPNLIYTPDTGFTGIDSFSFTASDAQDTSAVATVSITVAEASIALFSAVLPASRSVEVGATATAFATLINAGTVTAENCVVRLPDTVPANFFFQTTDAISNQLTGQPDTAVDLPAGSSQSFIFGVIPTEEFNALDVALEFQCSNATDASSIVGLNTLLLSASLSPVADLIALSATTTQNGVMELANNHGFFTVATINVGSAATISASVDMGSATLPLTLSVCQTNPVTSECINPSLFAGKPVIVDVSEGDSPTFAVFAIADGPIVLDPANSRVFIRFSDEQGIVRGSTSVAVENR